MKEIPDLENDEAGVEEDITMQVAAAPNVRAQKVQSLRELDSEAAHQLPVYVYLNSFMYTYILNKTCSCYYRISHVYLHMKEGKGCERHHHARAVVAPNVRAHRYALFVVVILLSFSLSLLSLYLYIYMCMHRAIHFEQNMRKSTINVKARVNLC